MARKGDIRFIPTAGPSGPAILPLDTIPTAIRLEVEEIYAALKSAGSGRMRVEFDTDAECKEYATQVKTYCQLRPTNVDEVKAQFAEVKDNEKLLAGITTGGPLRFRQSPTKGLPKTAMDFRVVDIPVEAEAATEAIKDATQAVKDAAELPTLPTAEAVRNVTAKEAVAMVTPAKATGRRSK